jgi:dTDP-4-amino-4,6-dideoxygalactose transaminase
MTSVLFKKNTGIKDTMKKIYLTQPLLPPLEKYVKYLEDIWERKFVTNNAFYHQQFEKKLAQYLEVENCSLLANGTLALIIGLQALRITGEVITTPYSFVATVHSLHWNGITPVFCDIEEETFSINPDKIESLITPKTTAILPVHIYGIPCNMEKINSIAETYGLKVIYDAAHAFGVKKNEKTILLSGDMSILSFHATKVFNTMEGGAIVTNDDKMKKRIDYLKNFGFADEVTVVAPGINAKMNELQAVLGILALEMIEHEIEKRKKVANRYRKNLAGIKGIKLFYEIKNIKHNYSYFPILIDQELFGKSRDDIYFALRKKEIYARRYFYPLISNFPTYRGLPSAESSNLPVAEKISSQILCLPIYGNLESAIVDKICLIIKKLNLD